MTGRDAEAIARVSYAELRERSSERLRHASRLRSERSAIRLRTLAWNTQAHLEAWYAIVGMGAVCHTLNPGLTAAQTASMLVQLRSVAC